MISSSMAANFRARLEDMEALALPQGAGLVTLLDGGARLLQKTLLVLCEAVHAA